MIPNEKNNKLFVWTDNVNNSEIMMIFCHKKYIDHKFEMSLLIGHLIQEQIYNNNCNWNCLEHK